MAPYGRRAGCDSICADCGRFDRETDVDVFLLELEASKRRKQLDFDWTGISRGNAAQYKVEDFFSVSVGAVVPFRLDGTGNWLPYAHANALPPWENVRRVEPRVRFTGTSHRPPFVLIRRTSKASYKIRCVATLVTGQSPVAVDNHLIVAQPRDGRVATCKRLLEILAGASTSIWMDARIRCRHLTVGSVREIPWPASGD